MLYPRSSPAYDIAITKILSVFDSKEVNADFTVINFELNQARGRETLQFAEKNKYDLIFAMGSELTAWLYDNYRGGAIPVVSVCSKDPVELGQMKDYESGSNINFAFTSLNMPVEVQLAYVMEFKPGLKNLAILVDSKNVSAVQTQAEPVAARARKQGINVFMGTVQNPAKAARGAGADRPGCGADDAKKRFRSEQQRFPDHGQHHRVPGDQNHQ